MRRRLRHGVVHLDTHGAFFEDTKSAEPPGSRPHFSILRTGDTQNVVQDAQYLANGDFTARAVDLPAVRVGKHYCVMNEFIRTYVNEFENHSIVFLNCCQTAQLPAGAIQRIRSTS